MHGRANHEDELVKSRSALYLGIEAQYGTLDGLKTSFSAAAMGVFSSGWVWCVTDARGNIGVLATYGAGTLLVSNRQQRFERDLSFDLGGQYVPGSTLEGGEPGADGASDVPSGLQPAPGPFPPSSLTGSPASSPTSGASLDPPVSSPMWPSRARSLHTTARALAGRVGTARPRSLFNMNQKKVGADALSQNTDPQSTVDFERLGETLYPLFCVSVHEHAWMGAGYGVWGKERYLANFWDAVDWERAVGTYELFAPNSVSWMKRPAMPRLGA
jgi:Fe-Mn family superoxide dismutase